MWVRVCICVCGGGGGGGGERDGRDMYVKHKCIIQPYLIVA